MTLKNLKKILAIMLVLLIASFSIVIPASAESNDSLSETTSTRASGTHQFINTMRCSLDVNELTGKITCTLGVNANEVMDEIGYSKFVIYQFNDETEEWDYYGQWTSQYTTNSSSFSKTAYKIGMPGNMYQVEVTYFATRYGTLFNETDEATILSNIVSVPE